MKKYLIVIGILSWSLSNCCSNALASKIVADVTDTLVTGVPIAVFAGIWWAVANRVPQSWQDVPEPAATFIKTTWKQQGFAEADRILLKEIPADSLFAKVIMYTQELPHALAVGIPFRLLIENCLSQKEELSKRFQLATDVTEKSRCQNQLEEIERKLDECRFVCGHERVHKENNHTFRMLIIQFIAPFVVHSCLKYTAGILENREMLPTVSTILRKKTTRSAFEMLIFWCSAHWYERQADMYASSDPEVIEAGIRLFERAREQKASGTYRFDAYKTVLLWILKYTHPTTSERIEYLKKQLAHTVIDE